ncbi:peptidylprolyl isomerase [Jongsikchunia kroppenstedtii]|uniref:peptidylprolyl isomerase n=1 Tax=Jongsikchunia kroppenstedtii TaxID=1121721 RepID=UPI000360AE3A|nr:peptidylprolyl isomerase [Jongsikchunia kroppenstedtii]
MSTNEERRLEAKRKLEQRLSDQEQAARKRKLIIGGSLGAVVLIAIIGFGTWGIISYNDSQYNKNHARCTYDAAPSYPDIAKMESALPQYNQQADEAVKSGQATQEQAQQYKDAQVDQINVLKQHANMVKTAPQPTNLRPSKKGGPAVVLNTTQGDITLNLKAKDAPCNVNAVKSLVENNFYNGSGCQRLVASQALTALQCGDPTGTGSGTPGWTSPDEFPTSLKPAPGDGGANGAVVYPRGSIAIANSYQAANPMSGEPASGQHTGSSQFFLVIDDTQLPANYTVIGSVDPASLAVLDKIKAGGINPPIMPNPAPQPGPITDGQPKLPVTIKTATIAK